MPRTIRTALLLTTTVLLAGCRMEDAKLMALTAFTDHVLHSAAAQKPAPVVTHAAAPAPLQICDVQKLKREVRIVVRAAARARTAGARRQVFIVTIPDAEILLTAARQL